MTNIIRSELHRIVTTAIIFREDGRVLIIKRAEDKKEWPGKWSIPGGGLETDDYTTQPPTYTGETFQWYHSLHNAVRREVLEETGLTIDEPWFVCDVAFIRSDGIPVIVLSYAANLIPSRPGYIPKVILNNESTEYAWVNFEEVNKFDLIDGIYHELALAFSTWIHN